MNRLVMKFGGTSVADLERIRNVALHVKREVVRSGEAPVALDALERLHPGVLAEVAGQLIGAGEPPLAALPRTPVRLLT